METNELPAKFTMKQEDDTSVVHSGLPTEVTIKHEDDVNLVSSGVDRMPLTSRASPGQDRTDVETDGGDTPVRASNSTCGTGTQLADKRSVSDLSSDSHNRSIARMPSTSRASPSLSREIITDVETDGGDAPVRASNSTSGNGTQLADTRSMSDLSSDSHNRSMDRMLSTSPASPGLSREIRTDIETDGGDAPVRASNSTSGSGTQLAYRRDYLNRLWDKGMTNTKTREAKELMKDAINVTGMQVKNIKSFIDRKRKQEQKNTLRKMTGATGRRLYDIFMSQELNKVYIEESHLTKEEKLRRAHDSWKKKKHDPTTLAELRSLHDEDDPPLKLSQEQNFRTMKRMLRKTVKHIQSMCSNLKSLGYEYLFIAVHKTNGDQIQIGTDKALVIAEEKGFLQALLSSVADKRPPSSLEMLNDEFVRCKLQTYFNDRYMKCLGIKRVQYDRIASGQVRVTGMPAGIPFRKPACYGRVTKVQILKEATDLKFTVCSEEVEDDVQESGGQSVDIQPQPALPVPVHSEEQSLHQAEKENAKEPELSQRACSPSPSDDDGAITHQYGTRHKKRKRVEQEIAVCSEERDEDVQESGGQSVDIQSQPALPVAVDSEDQSLHQAEEENTTELELSQRACSPPPWTRHKKRKRVEQQSAADDDRAVTHHYGTRHRKRKRVEQQSAGNKQIVKKSQRKQNESEEEYFVEEILEMKPAPGGKLFLVKWEGYSRKEATWEPRENLPRGMVEDFLWS